MSSKVEMNARIGELEAAIKQVGTELDRRRLTVQSLEARVREQEGKIGTLQAEVAKRGLIIEAAGAALGDQAGRITMLQAEVARRRWPWWWTCLAGRRVGALCRRWVSAAWKWIRHFGRADDGTAAVKLGPGGEFAREWPKRETREGRP